jgi:uncharacterized protein YoxC
MITLNNSSKEQPKSAHHVHHALWTVGAISLSIALVSASTWWLNSELQSQGSSVAKLLGMQQTVESLSQRMIGAEKALSSFPAEMNKVTGRVDALDRKVTAAQKAIAAKPATVTTPASPAVAELGNSVAQLHDRLATLQLQHEEDAAQIEALKAQTTDQIAAVRSEIPRDAMPDVASLRAAMDRNEAGISSLATKMDRDRHDFEIREDFASEVLPGVLLTIRDTNVSRQEISGWLYLENEHRVIYLKNQGLLQPITVYGVFGKEAHEIVITRVRKDDAIGFVLSPKTDVPLSAGN